MENFFTRYKNPLMLMAVLFIQVIALATQVKRPENTRTTGSGSTRLIRVWTMMAITPVERGLVSSGHFFRDSWRSYIDLHGVREQNRQLQEELARMRVEQVRLKVEAEQSQRLQALLDFKERYVGHTLAAQVIGTSGTDLLHVITINKGAHAKIKQDMPVITPDGIVGKVKDVYEFSSQVLLINDRESGAGVILESSRLQGVLHGVGLGELRVGNIMSDEKVEIGEHVITSGGDRIYPKGLPVGTVTNVGNDAEAGPFLAITVKPAANLNRLEEVLVVTSIVEESPAASDNNSAPNPANVTAQRSPSTPKGETKEGIGTAGTSSATAKETSPGAQNKLERGTQKPQAVSGGNLEVGQESGSPPRQKTPEKKQPISPGNQETQPKTGGTEKPPR